MITNENLVLEITRPEFGGTQRLYRFKNNYGLSVVNGPALHIYPFAWECAVIQFDGEDNETFDLCDATALKGDIAVFDTDEETNQFIEDTRWYFEAMN
jgi:hypothetical protein